MSLKIDYYMKKSTQQWDMIKPLHPTCLCYSEINGLYTKRFHEDEISNEIVCRPQGYVGYVSKKIEIAEQNVEIEILSNFGFGRASYHRAIIKKGIRRILDFDLSKMYVLHSMDVRTFDVPLYDWDKLFEKIIKAYRESFIESYTTESIIYLEGLNDMLDKDEIHIKGELGDEKSIEWNGVFLVMLFAGNKIRNLLLGFEEAQISDSIVINYTLNLCRKYISKIKLLELDYNDTRTSQISETLMLIHRFMCVKDAGIEYLSLILDKKM